MLPSYRRALTPGAVLVLALVLALLAGSQAAVAEQGSRQARPTEAAKAAEAAERVRNTQPAEAYDPDAPNVVLITTDDQTLDDLRHMPITRKLIGSKGVTFTQALSPHPLCCPARAEILTGQYAQNNGVATNGGEYGGYEALRDPDRTLPSWLQAAGYETAMLGKFVNKYRPVTHGTPAGWSDFRVSSKDSFGYYDFSVYANGERTDYDDGETYSTTYVTDAGVDLIEGWTQPEVTGPEGERRPFFIWASYYAPHGDCGEGKNCKVPPTPEEKYADAFADARNPALDKRSYRAKLRNPNPVIKRNKKVDKAFTQGFYRDRIRSLQSVDDGVLRLVSALERTGELDDTLLLFTSDNGYLLGEHRYVGKVLAYEESVRVPLLMRGPGVRAGTTSDAMATTVDLATTVAAAAGATPQRRVDGRDLRVLATDRDPADTVLVQAGNKPSDSADGRWMFRGVRTERWTYTKWKRAKGGLFQELFDLRKDPEQIKNLAEKRSHRKVVRDLRRRTVALADCAGPNQCFRSFGATPKPR